MTNKTIIVLVIPLLGSFSPLGCCREQSAVGPAPSQESNPGGAPRYTVTVLRTFDKGFFVGPINASGQIAGESEAPEPNPRWIRSKPLTRALRWTGTKMEDLGTLGGYKADVYGINASGQIAGTASFEQASNGSITYAVRWTGTTGEVLGTLGGDSEASGINASGQVAGASRVKPGGDQHAVRWTGTRPEDLGTLGGASSSGQAINDFGQVAGLAALPDDNGRTYHAVRWTGTKPEDLGTLGGCFSNGVAINARGQVAGESLLEGANPHVKHAVLWTETKPVDLGTLGGTSSWATDINVAGDVLGMSHITGESNMHPFLYTGGKMYDLNDLVVPGSGVTRFWVGRFDDHGQITGFGTIEGKSCAFRLDPVAKTK